MLEIPGLCKGGISRFDQSWKVQVCSMLESPLGLRNVGNSRFDQCWKFQV
jgi:hypothetical protein